MNFKFGRNIRRLNPGKRPLKILGTRGRGRSQGLSKIFRAAIYMAHRAVVFVIAPAFLFLIFTTRCTVRLSVTLVDQDHIGWKSWKLIARIISPTPCSSEPKGHPPIPRGTWRNFGDTRGGWGKVAISLKRINIEQKVWRHDGEHKIIGTHQRSFERYHP